MRLIAKKLAFFIFVSSLIAGPSNSNSETGKKKDEKVDGEYIMRHIQDDRIFEIFNPLDYNDANHGILTQSECKEVYDKYNKKYPDKKIKWKSDKNYEYSNNTNNSVYKKIVWHGSYDSPDEPAPCGDGYYFTKKIKLEKGWNKLTNLPFLGTILNWKWDPSKDPFAVYSNDNQLIFNKQLIMILLASFLILLVTMVGYKKDRKIQSGIGNLLEVFVVFIRDDIVYPNMGAKQGRRFLPLILTFFFFIVALNLLGLIPGSATSTASFSVTVGLALITFFTYIIFGNQDFWKHIFATPGVPFWLLPIMIPVELIGLITKPFALSVRLLANMNAGHIIILAFLGIIINMNSGWVALGSVPMALAINMLEIFVAFLQGYIFSLLSSIFIGMAVMEHEHH